MWSFCQSLELLRASWDWDWNGIELARIYSIGLGVREKTCWVRTAGKLLGMMYGRWPDRKGWCLALIRFGLALHIGSFDWQIVVHKACSCAIWLVPQRRVNIRQSTPLVCGKISLFRLCVCVGKQLVVHACPPYIISCSRVLFRSPAVPQKKKRESKQR